MPQSDAPPRRSRFKPLSACAIVALCLGLGAAARAQPAELPTVELGVGIHLIHAEVAADELSRMRGLMYRHALEPNHGMLFIFEQPGVECMWMRNTLLPLAVAFIGDDGKIVNIEEMKPQTDDSHCAGKPVRYALEMDGQWFSRRGIGAGSTIRGIDALRRPR